MRLRKLEVDGWAAVSVVVVGVMEVELESVIVLVGWVSLAEFDVVEGSLEVGAA